MKILQKSTVFLLLPLLLGFSFEPAERNLTAYRPILMKKTDLISSVFSEQPRDFSSPGKIYLYQDKIFIVDLYKGIHVIDNQNPESPVKTAFLHIPGVVDVAIRNHVLYADNAIDLVAIDVTALPQIKILDRVADIFPEHTPPDLEWIPNVYSSSSRPENTVIVAWVK